jgi:long-subunit acyl-CoA synthetase (AMP-forming)
MPNPNVVYEVLHRAGAVALVADRDFEPLLAGAPLPILYSIQLSPNCQEDSPPLPPLDAPSDPDNVVMIFHTSGSTSGSPKLVPITVKWLDFAAVKMRQFKTLDSQHGQLVVVSG